MLTLLIQSVFQKAQIALWDSDRGPAEAATLQWESQKDELQKLLPNIETLLYQKEGAWKDVGKIVIVVGVGNFSSTRLSVTMANMLGLLTGAPLYELRLEEEMPFGELIALAESRTRNEPVPLAQPQYKSEPVISHSHKPNFTGQG